MEATRFVIRGVQLDLTDALRQSAINKTAPLFRHNENIDSIYIDIELDHSRGAAERFVAKGHIELGGANLVASARGENAYKTLDLLVDAFDALLRSRLTRRTEQSNPPLMADADTGQLRN